MSSKDLRFLAGMGEKLGYYVYALVDPRGGIFYVGKGKGDRVYQHAAAALSVKDESAAELKLNTIRSIHRRSQAVGVEIIRHGLVEKEAFEVEGAVMDVLRLTGHHLTNVARGNRSRNQGYAPLDELRALYGASPVEIDGDDRLVLIRINKLYRPEMTEEELYTATREWWRMSPWHAPDHACAVYGGVVRAVYRIDKSVGTHG